MAQPGGLNVGLYPASSSLLFFATEIDLTEIRLSPSLQKNSVKVFIVKYTIIIIIIIIISLIRTNAA